MGHLRLYYIIIYLYIILYVPKMGKIKSPRNRTLKNKYIIYYIIYNYIIYLYTNIYIFIIIYYYFNYYYLMCPNFGKNFPTGWTFLSRCWEFPLVGKNLLTNEKWYAILTIQNYRRCNFGERVFYH